MSDTIVTGISRLQTQSSGPSQARFSVATGIRRSAVASRSEELRFLLQPGPECAEKKLMNDRWVRVPSGQSCSGPNVKK